MSEIHICKTQGSSIGKSLHIDESACKYQVIVYNVSKSGVMTSLKFESQYSALAYYNKALDLGYHATLIEL